MLITLNRITKTYKVGEIEIPALRGVSLNIDKGEFVAVMGASGSGKTTLMNIIGFLDQPTDGQYLLEDKEVTGLNRNALAQIRNKKIGFVFQSFNLLPRTTALENVELPLFYSLGENGDALSGRQKKEKAINMLKRLGLSDRIYHHPSQLSGGQQQRVAIARALINQPPIILADEPTGNLDTKSSEEIMDVFNQFNKEGITIILITHEHDIAKYAKRLIHIRDGQIVPN
ncbi:MAG: ABC transporter ATP-binding protein [Planctomycetes bacterium]|nr:ABC transporter ATP-binding protein [Planctomycetota bacterium]